MTAQMLIEKLGREVGELKTDITEMKQFLFQPLKDPEGEYRDAFVKKLFKRSLSPGPFTRFVNKNSFLTYLRGTK